MKAFRAVVTFFREVFTDAKGRPEIKMILGVPLLVGAVVYGVASRDWAGFGALSGVALSLVMATTAADSRIDRDTATAASASPERGQ